MKKMMTLLAVLALALTLLAGCGGGQEDTTPPAEPTPVQNEAPTEPAPTVQPEDKKEDETPSDAQPEAPVPEETEPAEAEPAAPQPEEKENGQSEEEAPAPTADPEPEPAPAEPEPAPEPEPEPEPEATVPEDGTYTASVTLEGGSGRATVESPATLRCEGGKFWAVIVWSSPNFDYMKVDGEKYPQTNTEGNSTFEIPVSAFDQKLDVIADTVAMSEPHEVEYTLCFDSASLQKR